MCCNFLVIHTDTLSFFHNKIISAKSSSHKLHFSAIYSFCCMYYLQYVFSLQAADPVSRREVIIGQGRDHSSNRSSTDQGGGACT